RPRSPDDLRCGPGEHGHELRLRARGAEDARAGLLAGRQRRHLLQGPGAGDRLRQAARRAAPAREPHPAGLSDGACGRPQQAGRLGHPPGARAAGRRPRGTARRQRRWWGLRRAAMRPSIVRTLLVALLLAAMLLFESGAASAQDAPRQALALELAKVLIDDEAQRGFADQVSLSMLRVIGTILQERLNRRLQDSEGRTLADIVRGFVVRTLPPARIHEIAARA